MTSGYIFPGVYTPINSEKRTDTTYRDLTRDISATDLALSQMSHDSKSAQDAFESAIQIQDPEEKDFCLVKVFQKALKQNNLELAETACNRVENFTYREPLWVDLTSYLIQKEAVTLEKVLEDFSHLQSEYVKQEHSLTIVDTFYEKNKNQDAIAVIEQIFTAILKSPSDPETKVIKSTSLILKTYETDIHYLLDMFYKIPTIPGGMILECQQSLAQNLCLLVDEYFSEDKLQKDSNEFKKDYRLINNVFYYAVGTPDNENGWTLRSLKEKIDRYASPRIKRKESQ